MLGIKHAVSESQGCKKVKLQVEHLIIITIIDDDAATHPRRRCLLASINLLLPRQHLNAWCMRRIFSLL